MPSNLRIDLILLHMEISKLKFKNKWAMQSTKEASFASGKQKNF